eukprot:SAG31_NODE_45688_length_257_cov_32.563291_1_plen_60_part_10
MIRVGRVRAPPRRPRAYGCVHVRARIAAHRVYNKQYLNLVPESTGFEYRIQVPETKFRFL